MRRLSLKSTLFGVDPKLFAEPMAVNEYIRRDVDGFQEEWLQCRGQDHEKNVRNDIAPPIKS